MKQLIETAFLLVGKLKSGISIITVENFESHSLLSVLNSLAQIIASEEYRTPEGLVRLFLKEFFTRRSFIQCPIFRISHCIFSYEPTSRGIWVELFLFVNCLLCLLWRNPLAFSFSELFIHTFFEKSTFFRLIRTPQQFQAVSAALSPLSSLATHPISSTEKIHPPRVYTPWFYHFLKYNLSFALNRVSMKEDVQSLSFFLNEAASLSPSDPKAKFTSNRTNLGSLCDNINFSSFSELILSFSHITSIDDAPSDCFIKTKNLYLEGNYGSYLPHNSLSPSELHSLHLAKNFLHSAATLSGLTALTTLDLSRNILSSVDSLSSLVMLTDLNVDENRLTSLSSSLSSLSNLKALSLFGNNLKFISPQTSRGWTGSLFFPVRWFLLICTVWKQSISARMNSSLFPTSRIPNTSNP